MTRFFSSIIIGLGLGYLAQRSRMCFVGGIRDYILVKDKTLLRGFAAFFITTWVIYSILFFSGILKPSIYGDTRSSINHTSEINEYSSSPEVFYGEQELSETFFDNIMKRIFVIPPKINLLSIIFLVSGFAIGILSVFANGCPLRQHILAAQGNIDSAAYLFGFYFAVVIYDFFTSKLIYLIFNYM